MKTQNRSTFILTNHSEILEAMVGLKGIRILHYARCGRDVELMVEQIVEDVRCPSCGRKARVKQRPVVSYVDLPVYGTPMRLSWKKHRMICINDRCPRQSFVLQDHRIAAKNCLLTTRAAKWATVEVGRGRSVSEVAEELACDWHTVNDAVTTYGEALVSDSLILTQVQQLIIDPPGVPYVNLSVPACQHLLAQLPVLRLS